MVEEGLRMNTLRSKSSGVQEISFLGERNIVGQPKGKGHNSPWSWNWRYSIPEKGFEGTLRQAKKS